MRRFTVLAAVLALGSITAVTAAYQQSQDPKVVEAERLKDNLWVLRGGGGNTAVFVTSGGVTVVDTKNPGWGRPILEKIREITDKPVTTIINTHTHGDHVSGNVEFPATVEVITHENTKANMEVMGPVSGMQRREPAPNIFKANNGRGMPTRTFKDKMSIGSGNDRIDLYYFGRGHTNGDTWIVFPALRLVHAGDMFPAKSIPLLDANNGGSGIAMPDTLAKAAQTLGSIDTIITGHSTQMTLGDLREYADFNRAFLEMVRAAKKAGRSVDDVAGTWTIPSRYQGYAEPQPARLKSNIQITYDELK